MRLKIKFVAAALLVSTSAWSDDGHKTSGLTVSSHAPLGVMGDHMQLASGCNDFCVQGVSSFW